MWSTVVEKELERMLIVTITSMGRSIALLPLADRDHDHGRDLVLAQLVEKTHALSLPRPTLAAQAPRECRRSHAMEY